MLFEFYRTTAGHALGDPTLANECPSLGSHWEIVAFQGTNPATDLRGVGILGLLQLYVHDTQENKLQPIVKLSREEPNDFPLAVVGLNFTSLILTKLRGNELNQIATFCGGFLVGINQIYRGCFIYFTQKWEKDNGTIKDAQTILNEIQSLLKRDPWKLVKQSSFL